MTTEHQNNQLDLNQATAPEDTRADRSFDTIADHFEKKVYGGLKGEIRLAVLRRDIVEYSMVGDTYMPILRTIPIYNADYGDMKHYEFIHPHYLKLQTRSISVIEIRICNSVGELIPFEQGSALVKLHFKKHESNL